MIYVRSAGQFAAMFARGVTILAAFAFPEIARDVRGVIRQHQLTR